MNLSAGGFFTFLITFQFLFGAVFLLTHNKGNKRNNRLLGMVFLLFSISIADFTIRISGITFTNKALHLIDDGFFFIYGPLLYLYVKGVVYNDFNLKTQHLIHFLPYAPVGLYTIYLIFLADPYDNDQLMNKIFTSDLPAWMFLMSSLIYIHLLLYLSLCWRMVARYRSIIMNTFSSIHLINLDWLRFMIRAFVAIVVFAMLHNVLPFLGNIYIQYGSLLALLVFSFFFINRVLVKALNQPAIFSGIKTGESEKYAGSLLTPDEIKTHEENLSILMQKEKIYLNPDLKLNELAQKLNISAKTLSQVINQQSGKNFFDYVNTFRCDEVKRILTGEDQKITILEAMYQAGFNSKSSFNKEFKKLTGQTPSQFKKNLRN